MNRTKIEWVRNPDGTQGYTWNPITGCLGPDGTPENPKRCPYCYAHRLANGRLKKLYLRDPVYPHDPPLLVPNTDPSDRFSPRFWTHRISEPGLVRQPSAIFVCSMGELFSDYYPASWLGRALQIFYANPRHTFLVLTKDPPRAEVTHLPDNVWFGVTINKGEDWLRLRIAEDCEAGKKFISFEPLLDDVMVNQRIQLVAFDWIIIGAQTKPYLPPKKEWVEGIMEKANRLGIPVFLKNNLHWPERIQEFPVKKGGIYEKTTSRALQVS